MKKRTLIQGGIAVAVAAGLAVTGTVVAQADENGDDQLAEALDTILTDARYDGSQVGVVVTDAESGEVIYNHGGGKRAIPASNNKLQTSMAAMGILGPDYTFHTDLVSTASPDGGTLAGDLYLRGTGDPTMLAEDYGKLAGQLAEAGVTTVDGDLVADDTAYDSQPWGTEWGWDDLPWYYAAEVSALTVAPDEEFDNGSVRVDVTPGGAAGDPASVALTPATDWVTVDSSVETVAAGEDTWINMDRAPGSKTITVSGQVAADADYWDLVTVPHPTGYAADVFAKALADNGITVTGDVRLGEAAPDGAESLADHASMPLSDLLTPFLKLSNNGHAETLLKAMGRKVSDDGSFGAGAAAAQDYLASLGVKTDRIRQVDGSGMSRQNVVSPKDLTSELVVARDQDWFDAWYQALPIACQDDPMVGGTLASRMCDTDAAGNLHGKTGSMTGVSTLSGYVTDADGRELVFSIMNNDFVANTVKDLEDRIAATIAASGGSQEIGTKSIEVPQPDKEQPTDKECSWVRPMVC